MKRSTALFLQFAVVLLGLGTLAVLLIEPHFEGRNAHATVFEVYFKDPFLAYVYVGSVPFFRALYRAFGLLGHAGRHGKFSQVTVDGLRAIQRCALAVGAFVVGAIGFIVALGDNEDRPAGFMMVLIVTSAAGAVAFTAATLARKLQSTLRTGSD